MKRRPLGGSGGEATSRGCPDCRRLAQELEVARWEAQRLRRDGGRLADEVAALVRRRAVDSRSPVADALLDYRDPPSTPRADRLAAAERRAEFAEAEAAAIRDGQAQLQEQVARLREKLLAAAAQEEP